MSPPQQQFSGQLYGLNSAKKEKTEELGLFHKKSKSQGKNSNS
jgi:hypothetical protein